MTAPTKNRQSAYPATVADLLPEARTLAARLGELPSRNRLMTELHIGAPKARDLLAELRRLRLVTDTELDALDGTEPEPAEVVPGPTDTEPAEPTAPDPGASPEPTGGGPDTGGAGQGTEALARRGRRVPV
jgi:hypothetical protein